MTYEASARRVQGVRDVRSKCGFAGLWDTVTPELLVFSEPRPFWVCDSLSLAGGGVSVSSQSSHSRAGPFLQYALAGHVPNPVVPGQSPTPLPPSRPKLPEEAGLGRGAPTQPGRPRSSALPWDPPRRGASVSLQDSGLSLAVSLFPAPSSPPAASEILYSHLILFNYSIIKHIIKT